MIHSSFNGAWCAFLALMVPQFLPAQEKDPDALPAESERKSIGASLASRTEARTFQLAVPAPRGLITDRNGYPLAQTKVAYYAAISFPFLGKADDEEIVSYARERVDHINTVLGGTWKLSAQTATAHYHNRRWLPLPVSDTLNEDQAETLRKSPLLGVVLHPVYLRHYPQGAFMSHVLGYVGKSPPWSTREIQDGESLWPEGIGVDGLEESLDGQLRGESGRIDVLYEADGTKVKEEVLRRPRPGNTVVLSIDAEMQRIAEGILKRNVRRGAFVVTDVRTGDILVLASWPQYDPNDFIPAPSAAKLKDLNADPDIPLMARAFRATYPPASTFKITTALAALETKTVDEKTLFNCGTAYQIGDLLIHNWNKEPEGMMNVVGAITRSCNTWFYPVGVSTGVDAISSMANRLGFGERTGLPLRAESDGFVPTDRWSREKFGYNLSSGDVAVISIGQGALLCTPLQAARVMAAVANRHYVMKPRLVLQVQDLEDHIIQSYPAEEKNATNIDPYYLDIVFKGMENVVNAGNGTGKAAGHPKILMAGKTGTGQWKPHLEQNVAWFAGFAPADYPVLSFSVLYEGAPGERLSGGRNAAPLVGEFFEKYFADEEHLASLQESSQEMRAQIASLEPEHVRPDFDGIFTDAPANPAATEGVPQPPPQQASQKESGLIRWFRKLRDH
ncbi:MAG: penicillin-binding transpeptidase domain-containing protein [Verrucomicrobiales bacterium]|nr:hypothetical protein [Verrucomicrobiae bacterium]MCP5552821.1 hypothetical protein [Akkermansiaceae bacterium]